MNVDDLDRGVLRKEVLFYHQVLEKSLDHLLQALYALNRTYFPSRKRIEEYIQRLGNKPKNCYERLLGIIEMAASTNIIVESVKGMKNLEGEVREAFID
ncbi:hypothetical protein LXJ15735_38130 [Lacrimispora xylanolytica]